NDTAACVHMTNSSPIIRDNTLRNCVKGIDVNRDSSPTVIGNEITSNRWGVMVYGGDVANPQPVVTGNSIYANNEYDYTAERFTTSGSTLLLNAQGNWWGSVDPTSIAAKINDLSDDYSNTRKPIVDFSNYLDGPNGSP